MYKERMELYKRENPNVIFPDFQEIPSEECKSLSLEISKKFLNEAFSGLDLLTQLFKKAVRIENVNAASECFSLIETGSRGIMGCFDPCQHSQRNNYPFLRVEMSDLPCILTQG